MGYFDRCHLLESGEPLSGLWIARYLAPTSPRGSQEPPEPYPSATSGTEVLYTWNVVYLSQYT